MAALSEQSMRWGQLHDYIEGISEKMLAQTLRTLEADGFVLRESAGTVPPRVDYSLTPLGRELAEVLNPLVRWVADNVTRTTVRVPSSVGTQTAHPKPPAGAPSERPVAPTTAG